MYFFNKLTETVSSKSLHRYMLDSAGGEAEVNYFRKFNLVFGKHCHPHSAAVVLKFRTVHRSTYLIHK